MSSVIVSAENCTALGIDKQVIQSYPSKSTSLGNLKIIRALPIREKRLVGPWCFLDRFGPLTFKEEKLMDIAPHPHIGLQTVSWLLEGEILHNDSLGCEGLTKPGGVNVMTAGHGISHAEETPVRNSGRLNGVQLWTVLPDTHRNIAPSFQSIDRVPEVDLQGGKAQVFSGTFAGVTSPAQHYSEIVGADLVIHPKADLIFPVKSSHEHAVLLLSGDAEIEGQSIVEDTLYYLGNNRDEICLRTHTGARLLLIGGLLFKESILMWWNFVARTPEEIAEASRDWEEGERFGEVKAYKGQRLSAPPLAHIARPNPIS